jgi:hypothetical protein
MLHPDCNAELSTKVLRTTKPICTNPLSSVDRKDGKRCEAILQLSGLCHGVVRWNGSSETSGNIYHTTQNFTIRLQRRSNLKPRQQCRPASEIRDFLSALAVEADVLSSRSHKQAISSYVSLLERDSSVTHRAASCLASKRVMWR